MSKILAGYIRVSTEMQVDKDSLSAQTEAIEQFAKSKNLECKIYRDAGISAKDTNRPEFQNLVDAIKQKKIGSVVVYKLDGITRNLKDLISLNELFDDPNFPAFTAARRPLSAAAARPPALGFEEIMHLPEQIPAPLLVLREMRRPPEDNIPLPRARLERPEKTLRLGVF